MLWLVVVQQHVMCNSLSLTLHVLVLVVACLPLRFQHLSCSNPVTHTHQAACFTVTVYSAQLSSQSQTHLAGRHGVLVRRASRST